MAGIAKPVTKFKLLVANLPTTVAAQVRDVIVSAPGDFDGLCTALRQRLSLSPAPAASRPYSGINSSVTGRLPNCCAT